MDKQTAIDYANAFAFLLSREITGPQGHTFTLSKKMKTKEGGFGFAFTSETFAIEYVLRCNQDGEIKITSYDKDGNVTQKRVGKVQYTAGADIRNVWNQN